MVTGNDTNLLVSVIQLNSRGKRCGSQALNRVNQEDRNKASASSHDGGRCCCLAPPCLVPANHLQLLSLRSHALIVLSMSGTKVQRTGASSSTGQQARPRRTPACMCTHHERFQCVVMLPACQHTAQGQGAETIYAWAEQNNPNNVMLPSHRLYAAPLSQPHLATPASSAGDAQRAGL